MNSKYEIFCNIELMLGCVARQYLSEQTNKIIISGMAAPIRHTNHIGHTGLTTTHQPADNLWVDGSFTVGGQSSKLSLSSNTAGFLKIPDQRVVALEEPTFDFVIRGQLCQISYAAASRPRNYTLARKVFFEGKKFTFGFSY